MPFVNGNGKIIAHTTKEYEAYKQGLKDGSINNRISVLEKKIVVITETIYKLLDILENTRE